MCFVLFVFVLFIYCVRVNLIERIVQQEHSKYVSNIEYLNRYLEIFAIKIYERGSMMMLWSSKYSFHGYDVHTSSVRYIIKCRTNTLKFNTHHKSLEIWTLLMFR